MKKLLMIVCLLGLSSCMPPPEWYADWDVAEDASKYEYETKNLELKTFGCKRLANKATDLEVCYYRDEWSALISEADTRLESIRSQFRKETFGGERYQHLGNIEGQAVRNYNRILTSKKAQWDMLDYLRVGMMTR